MECLGRQNLSRHASLVVMRLWCETLPLCRLRCWNLILTICLAICWAHIFGRRRRGEACVNMHGRSIFKMLEAVDFLGLRPDEAIEPNQYLSGYIPTYLRHGWTTITTETLRMLIVGLLERLLHCSNSRRRTLLIRPLPTVVAMYGMFLRLGVSRGHSKRKPSGGCCCAHLVYLSRTA
jgi:hypothetical protein